MITIIHGDDIVSSRKYLTDQKQKYKNSYNFDPQLQSLTDLVQIVEGGSLFNDEKFIFIENLLSSKKLQDELISYINTHSKDAEFFLWEEKELPAKTISQFPKAKAQAFKFPQKLFVFLDSLKPEDKTSISLFHELLLNLEPELIFFMIIRQFRILLSVLQNSKDSIDEVKRLQPWQMTKLQKQALLFRKEKLLSDYNKLYKIEVEQKTGAASMPLSSSIDFFLADL